MTDGEAYGCAVHRPTPTSILACRCG